MQTPKMKFFKKRCVVLLNKARKSDLQKLLHATFRINNFFEQINHCTISYAN